MAFLSTAPGIREMRMASAVLARHSIKTRVSLATLTVFVVGFWSLAFFASRMLREDMAAQAGLQQFSTASFVAAAIDGEMGTRWKALNVIAEHTDPALLEDAEALQAWLEARPILQTLFNGGTYVARSDGTAIVDIPLSAGRRGVNYMDRDYMVAALREGRASIGRPILGRMLKSPVFVMAVPLRGAQGKVVGALTGVTDLGKPNFLDKVTEGRYGRTGGYLLVAPRHRVILTASDRSRILQALPPPGVHALFDRFLQGHEGSGISVDSSGVEVLASAKGIPQAGWFVAITMTATEAFAPIKALRQRLLLATVLMTLLAGGLIWWQLRRQFAPLEAIVKTLSTMRETDQSLRSLSPPGSEELGRLIGSFNHLLETIGQREAALRMSEERLAGVLEAADVGTWEWNVQTGETLFNERWAEILGYTLGELSPVSIETWMKFAHPGDLKASDATLERHFRGDLSHYSHECRVLHRDGSWIWVLDRGRVVSWDEAKSPLVMRGIRTDITERKRLEAERAELEAQKRQLQKAESLGRMAGSIAHHFNNKLQSVLANLELLAECPHGLDPAPFVARARRATEKAAEVSRLMLVYLGQNVSKGEPHFFSELCRDGLRELQKELPSAVTLETDFPTPGPVIRADAEAIHQLLRSLGTNAWEALGEAAGTISFALGIRPAAAIPTVHRFPVGWRPTETDYACLEVADTGCGITETDIEKLFDPFYSTKFIGRGLGLPVVLGLVQAQGGAITVESRPGKGSVFRVFWALCSDPVPSASMPRVQPTSPASGTVLVVDDDEILLESTECLIGRLGFTVLKARDGLEALEVFRQHQDEIRCVLTDLTMPRMDGWETLAALRRIDPALPVILASGHDRGQVLAAPHPDRPQAFLGKPFGLQQLRDALAAALHSEETPESS